MPVNWIEVFQVFGPPIGILTAFVYAYSHAITDAIHFAQDEQHRLTSEDSWYFFDLKFRASRPRLLRLLALTMTLAITVASVGPIADPWHPPALEIIGISTYVLSGFLSFALGVVTLSAPRFHRPSILALWGSFITCLTWLVMLSLADISVLFAIMLGLFPGVSYTVYFLVWLIIESERGAKWFRINP